MNSIWLGIILGLVYGVLDIMPMLKMVSREI